MALSVKTEEADRLARELSRLTGETMTETITKALRERLQRLRREQAAEADIVERMHAFAQSIAHRYDRRPVGRSEWDAASGDSREDLGF